MSGPTLFFVLISGIFIANYIATVIASHPPEPSKSPSHSLLVTAAQQHSLDQLPRFAANFDAAFNAILGDLKLRKLHGPARALSFKDEEGDRISTIFLGKLTAPLLHEYRHCKYIKEIVPTIAEMGEKYLSAKKGNEETDEAAEAWTKLENEVEKFWYSEKASHRLNETKLRFHGLGELCTAGKLIKICKRSGCNPVAKVEAEADEKCLVTFDTAEAAQAAIRGIKTRQNGKIKITVETVPSEQNVDVTEKLIEAKFKELCRKNFEDILRAWKKKRVEE